jgi:TRAP-type C4-dicarboxylate transport system permease small subunit
MTTALTIGLILIFLILAFAFKIITVRELQIIIQALRHKN